jgi:3-hydroxybutyryl-CoA dehydratase
MEATKLSLGMQFRYSRQISVQDIREFTKASHDANIYHVQEDDSGRVIAHGLLVASLITKIGGDLNFLARTMVFDFLKPTYSGDTLTCIATLDSLVEQRERMKCKLSFTISNQKDDVVMVGETAGMIRRSWH